MSEKNQEPKQLVERKLYLCVYMWYSEKQNESEDTCLQSWQRSSATGLDQSQNERQQRLSQKIESVEEYDTLNSLEN